MRVLSHYRLRIRQEFLADLMPTPQVAVAPFPSAPAQASDVVSMVSAVVDALNIPSIVKKCSKRAQDSDADSEEGGAIDLLGLHPLGLRSLGRTRDLKPCLK